MSTQLEKDDLPLTRTHVATALFFYFLSLAAIIIWEANALSYPIFLFSFFVLAAAVTKLPLYRHLKKLSGPKLLFLLFLLAFILRILLLLKGSIFEDQIVTEDIIYYKERTERMQQGELPFRDFNPKHPPLYPLTLFTVALLLGNHFYSYRLFFSFFDSIITVLIFKIFSEHYSKDYGIYTSLIYILSPLNIVAVGLSGHYDPIVSFFVLLGVLSYLKKSHLKSSLFLGMGFAYKYYPLVLFPFFIWKIKDRKIQCLFTLFFFLPFVLSFLPFILISPEGTWHYLFDQAMGWNILYSFAFGFKWIFYPAPKATALFSGVIMLFFSLCLIFLFLSWVDWKEYNGIFKKWVQMVARVLKKRSRKIYCYFSLPSWKRMQHIHRFVLFVYLIFFGFLLAAAPKYLKERHNNPYLTSSGAVLLTLLIILIYIPIVYFAYKKMIPLVYKPSFEKFKWENYKKEELFLSSSFAIIFLLFAPPDYCGWYLIWLLPFILGIKTKSIRYSLLFITLWNVG